MPASVSRRGAGGVQIGTQPLAQFDVGQIGNGAAGGGEPVAGADAGMIEELGADGHGADFEVKPLDFLDGEIPGI